MFDSRRGAVFAVAVVLAAGALVGVPKGEAQVSGTSSGVSAPAAPAPALPAVASGSDGPPSSIPPASGVGPSATAEAAAPVSATTPAPSARLRKRTGNMVPGSIVKRRAPNDRTIRQTSAWLCPNVHGQLATAVKPKRIAIPAPTKNLPTICGVRWFNPRFHRNLIRNRGSSQTPDCWILRG